MYRHHHQTSLSFTPQFVLIPYFLSAAQCVSNKPFLSWVLCLFENECLCTAVHDRMSTMPVQEKLISI